MLKRTSCYGLAFLVIMVAELVVMPLVAQADEPHCAKFDMNAMTCKVWVVDPVKSEDSVTEGGQVAVSVCVSDFDGVIPCEVDGAYWNASRECYDQVWLDLATAPDDNSYVLEFGHEGVMRQCQRTLDVGLPSVPFFVSAAPPPPPNPEILVNEAIGTMSVTASAMGVWPGGWFDENSQAMGAVGLPVWFWSENPGPGVSGIATASAVSGTYMVFAQANLAGVTWSDDVGHSVECRLGSAPRVGETAWDSPSGCGWTYDQQGDYQVTAVTHIRVDWTSNYGRAGTRTYDLSGPTHTLRIGEIQVLSRR
jgi:hypothetical protein